MFPVLVLAAEPALTPSASERAVGKPRSGLISAGAWTLGTTHVVTLGFAGLQALGSAGHRTTSESSYYAWLLAPVVGPWISLGYASGNNASGMTLVSVVSGTLQTAGAGLIVLGVVWKRTEKVEAGGARVELAPMAMASGGGLLVRGDFQ